MERKMKSREGKTQHENEKWKEMKSWTEERTREKWKRAEKRKTKHFQAAVFLLLNMISFMFSKGLSQNETELFIILKNGQTKSGLYLGKGGKITRRAQQRYRTSGSTESKREGGEEKFSEENFQSFFSSISILFIFNKCFIRCTSCL